MITDDGRVESNGNFHGAPVGYVLDFLAIAVADVASMSERRTDRFLDVARSNGLPPFLAHDPGVDSGLMIAQYTAAGLVSELKRLAVPASVDSIPSSAMQEDHVSMGWHAARKLRRAIDGLTRVLGIELLTAARAMDLRAPLAAVAGHGRRPGPAARARASPAPARTRTSPPTSRPRRTPSATEQIAARAQEPAHDPGPRPVRAPRGTTLTARSWQTEAPLRMLMNNLDPEVAERPDDLVVYGGTGKAARSWDAYDAIVRTLTTLGDDETLLVQSGKPVGVLTTHEWAPRVLIANSNLVGDWATWPEFRRLEQLGLTMYGQMTAGSWIYIGTQGILQGTYETLAAVAAKRFGGTLAGTLTVTGGCGGMGGAQPLAVTLNGGACLIVDVDGDRLHRRVRERYLDRVATSLDEAIALVTRSEEPRRPRCPSASSATRPRSSPSCCAAASRSTSSPTRPPRTTRCPTCPVGVDVADWASYAAAKPEEFTDRARESMARHVEAMVGFMDAGAEVFDYGNSIRDEARQGGYDRAFDFPGFVPAYIRPLFAEGKGPFRWAALSGDPRDIAVTDQAVLDLFPDDDHLHRWIRAAQDRVAFQGLPARICWLGHGERDRAGLRFNELVASGEVSAPLVIGRDHLDAGSVASPYRETEGMADGSDAIADWPLLNALVAASSGATWVSIHHGGGVGMGRSIHAGQVSVADGTELAARKLARVLSNDPGMGVLRHVDAGYPRADEVATANGLRVPMREGGA